MPSALDFIVDYRVRMVVDHWRSLVIDDAPPARRSLDPAQMRQALPFIWIVEKQAGAAGRYRVELSGEEVNSLFGESLRKRFIDDIFPLPIATEVARKCDIVVTTPALIWTLGPFFAGVPNGPVGECAVAPVVGNGGQQAVLGVTVPKATMTTPPRCLFPTAQDKRVLVLGEMVLS